MGAMTLTSDSLVVAIRAEHEAASQAARSALEHALECGRLLAQARASIPHGGWETFVANTCGIAPRTGRLYLRLHANRGRLEDRQRVAGLTVREAAKLVADPRPSVAADRPQEHATAPRWYRTCHRHFGVHSSGWFFEVWPHPAGDTWAHYFICSPPSGHPGDEEGGTIVGPKRGIRVDAIEWSMERQGVNGLPPLGDSGWRIDSCPCDVDDPGDAIASRFKYYNTLLFANDDDYRKRGLGLQPKRPGAASHATAT
jgi:hypothetical protein